MDIKQLKYFIEVATREHISEAALELSVAQSAVSRQIDLLEKELALTLFRREGRNIYLTAEGRQLLEHAQDIIERVDQTVDMFREKADTFNQTVRIGYCKSYVSQVLAKLIATFEAQTNSKIVPMLMTEEAIDQALRTKQIDIALTEPSKKMKTDTLFQKKLLFEEQYTLIVPSGHDLTHAPNPPLSQIKHEQMYQFESLPPSILNILSKHLINPIYTIDHSQLASHLVSTHQGIVILPTNHTLASIKPLLKSKVLEAISLQHTELRRPIYMVTRSDNHKHDLKMMQAIISDTLQHTPHFH